MGKKKCKRKVSHPGLREIDKSLTEISLAVTVRMDEQDIPKIKRFLETKARFRKSIMAILERKS